MILFDWNKLEPQFFKQAFIQHFWNAQWLHLNALDYRLNMQDKLNGKRLSIFIYFCHQVKFIHIVCIFSVVLHKHMVIAPIQFKFLLSLILFKYCIFIAFFGPGGLRAPCMLACAMRACMRHACLRAPCVAWPLIFIVQSFSPLFYLSSSIAFDPLRGISRVWTFVSPNILA